MQVVLWNLIWYLLRDSVQLGFHEIKMITVQSSCVYDSIKSFLLLEDLDCTIEWLKCLEIRILLWITPIKRNILNGNSHMMISKQTT